MNVEWARIHTTLLSLMRQLELSWPVMRRILDKVNALIETPEAAIEMTKRLVSILQSCKTEEEVILKLDEVGL